MASLYKRGETWWVKYTAGGRTVRESLKTRSKAVAKRELQAREAKLLEGHHIAPVKLNPAIEDFWAKYLDWAQDHLRPRSIEACLNSWRHLMGLTQARRLGDITRPDIERFKKARLGKGDSPRSVNHHLVNIRAIFNRAIKQGWYTGPNPSEGVERYRVPKTKPEFHTEEDLNALLEAAQA